MRNESTSDKALPIDYGVSDRPCRTVTSTFKEFLIGGAGFIGLVAAFVGVLLICTWGFVRWLTTPSAPALPAPPAPVVFVSNGPTITQLQSLGSLTVLKVNVADVLEGSGNGYKGSWLVKGDALLAIDCRNAVMRDTNVQAKTAVIVLPPPAIIQPRVDHSRTRVWNVEKTTWLPFGGDEGALRDAAMRQAQSLVEKAVNNLEVLGQARQNAEIIIANMYRLVGWSVTIQWADRSASPRDGGP